VRHAFDDLSNRFAMLLTESHENPEDDVIAGGGPSRLLGSLLGQELGNWRSSVRLA